MTENLHHSVGSVMGSFWNPRIPKNSLPLQGSPGTPNPFSSTPMCQNGMLGPRIPQIPPPVPPRSSKPNLLDEGNFDPNSENMPKNSRPSTPGFKSFFPTRRRSSVKAEKPGKRSGSAHSSMESSKLSLKFSREKQDTEPEGNRRKSSFHLFSGSKKQEKKHSEQPSLEPTASVNPNMMTLPHQKRQQKGSFFEIIQQIACGITKFCLRKLNILFLKIKSASVI